ncbi:uncharacterized protein LOC124207082 [Daphnia pulex]|uniref:uncharacterized protein LOC124207082 n=1 Tax=Daphnia pulex TaxID=6669 RepID=UPI001EDF8602|nr:uncharacterized protein LOC124207082 [Daphnia pulex]
MSQVTTRHRKVSQNSSNADSSNQKTDSSLIPRPQPRPSIKDKGKEKGEAAMVMNDLEVKEKESQNIENITDHDVTSGPPSIQPQNESFSKDCKFNHIFKNLLIGVAGLSIISCVVIVCNKHTFLHSFNSSVGNYIKPNVPAKNVDHWDLAMDLIDEMKNSFPLQKRETWISFISALGSVTENEEPSQPAVLLFVGGNTLIATHTMQCVALTLANNTNKLLPPAMISDNDVSSEVIVKVDTFANLQNQEEMIKKELDDRIRSILNKSHSVVVGPLEKIPPGAATILHGYCDNFEAPFKKSVIILTATFDSDKPLNSKQLERRLHELWDHKLSKDKCASIVSRIANNVVFIEPETGPMPCTI